MSIRLGLHRRTGPGVGARSVLAGAVVATLLFGTTAANAGPGSATRADDLDGLRGLAAKRGLLIGSAVYNPPLLGDARYRALLAREFSAVSPGNVMKWDTVEPERGMVDLTAADHMMRFASGHRQIVRGHTLVWHNQLPYWLTQKTWSDADLATILEKHVKEEAAKFRGRVYAWDVINEPFNEDGTWRETIWYKALGPGYVAKALQWAHEADPRAKLYLNDYNLEWNTAKADAMYALVSDLRERGVPVHGVGFQGHLGIQYDYPAPVIDHLRRFTGLGLDVAITEADVRMPLPVTDAKLATQADYFGRLLSACLAVRRCVSFTIWGLSDAHSWVPGVFAGQGAATPYDHDLRPKPAYAELREALRHRVAGSER
ncbi:endo-1,4-beta-xylanase [Actinomadura sp. HBU206391]|uniref:endo-1,4-beta-xylanase n=1 Tax=Actinomadura sp. HBU206391 TaxID=2731692 RepID=UPI00164F6F26|nr:endo-1,4-beta-xylanase [Actinomadura sp. HBU206391]MBC6463675.1 endo-1,4-beta-xylanase [Actinomadura sp. HBU206391]